MTHLAAPLLAWMPPMNYRKVLKSDTMNGSAGMNIHLVSERFWLTSDERHASCDPGKPASLIPTGRVQLRTININNHCFVLLIIHLCWGQNVRFSNTNILPQHIFICIISTFHETYLQSNFQLSFTLSKNVLTQQLDLTVWVILQPYKPRICEMAQHFGMKENSEG